ncbi:LamG-like jellyroll fold domain-containing protein [Geminisphaera colitermitum]|uniref:LamG-like jellyroll fold domain-containing protein n=1 Tax=Geminisphaera colitermitum TaxID=1148786 RepID=UPI000196544A|nr:LamG-like jellyroll fold domain-containing protein [Geminisphaera colitermitum]
MKTRHLNAAALLFVIAALLATSWQAHAADPIAAYPLNHADKGTAEAGQVLDTAGDPPSDAIKRINWPRWTNQTQTGIPVPNNPKLGAPADGRAIMLGMSHGHDFGSGAQGRLKLTQGPFTIFLRLFYTSGGDLRIGRKDSMEIRFLTDKKATPPKDILTVIVMIDGKRTTVSASPGTPDQWHDYVVTFTPGGKLAIYTDGAVSGQHPVPDAALDTGEGGFHYENYNKTPQYIESLRIYNTSLSASEVAALSKEIAQ